MSIKIVQSSLNNNSRPAEDKGHGNLAVFFDGGCYLCSREIDVYRRQRQSHRLTFIDINQADFRADHYNLDPSRVHEVFHVQRSDGQIVTGVPAFVAIWEQLGWTRLSKFAKWPVVQGIMGLGYVAFAKLRPWLPRREPVCVDGVCGIPLHERSR